MVEGPREFSWNTVESAEDIWSFSGWCVSLILCTFEGRIKPVSGRWMKTKYRSLEMVTIGEVSLTWPPGDLAKQLRAPAVRLDILVEILPSRYVTREDSHSKSEHASTYHIGMVM